MTNEIIKYFKGGLRKKLRRPNCGRFLALWDDRIWRKYEIKLNLDYVESNDFLIFLYQTKSDLCCVEDFNAQALRNAIDKFFYLMYEFETYYNIFISNKIYRNRLEIVNDVIHFYQFNSLPGTIYYQYQYRYIELFEDLLKKIDEWNYWKRIIIISYTKIILSDLLYQYAKKYATDFLQELISNIEKVFNKGMEN